MWMGRNERSLRAALHKIRREQQQVVKEERHYGSHTHAHTQLHHMINSIFQTFSRQTFVLFY